MARKIPPFAALRAFEALARGGTLQEAADELHISSSAVSHQVKSLETFLSAKLAIRKSHGLELTPIGHQLLAGLGDALDRIEAATLSVLQSRKKGGVTVHLFQSLAQLWLIPQLGDFLSANPDISVKLVSKFEDVDLSGADVDLDFKYAVAPPIGPFVVEKLFDEIMMPVCSPEYLRMNGPIERPADLLDHRLIGSSYDLDEWNIWFKAVGVETPPVDLRLVFDQRSQVLQAAGEGLGIGMDRRPLGDLMLKRGFLVAPISAPVPTNAGYYLLAPHRSSVLPHVKQFRAWLSTICTELRAM
jgi:LysR family glycine cleavage system transcriptional activator